MNMKAASRALLDRRIDRRTFITRATQCGMSAAAAAGVADALAGPGQGPPPAPGRVVENLTGGELMAEFLLEWSMPYVFGLAGSEEVGFLDALVDRVSLHYATGLHEGAVMAMADGYSRSTGRTALVQLHSVAGAAYALGQLVGSFRDRIPVVVTAGRQSTDFRGHDGFLEAENLHMLPAEYARWTWDVLRAETIPEVLRRAFLLAEAPPGGPTFVTLSKDLLETPVARAELLPRARSRVDAGLAPSPAQVERIAGYLRDASFPPVLLLGNECIREDISDGVAAIAEQAGALVTLANKVPVVFPNTHPHYAGHFQREGGAYRDRIDTFWSLGAPLFKAHNRPEAPLVPRGARLVHTSLAAADVGRNYPVDAGVVAGLPASVAAVREALERRPVAPEALAERQRWIEDWHRQRAAAHRQRAAQRWDNQPMSTARLFCELDRQIAEDAFVVSEVVTAEHDLRRYLRFDHRRPAARRRRNFDTTSGVLGWGLAAAIGVKIGNPDREVWCLTGDGCFNFGNQALWSAARYEVPIGIVVVNNGQYQANRLNQNLYGGRMLETGKYIGVSLGHPDIDYVALAAAYGIEGERVSGPGALAAAIGRCRGAMAAGRPYVLDCVVERYFAGADSEYFDFFSVAEGLARQS